MSEEAKFTHKERELLKLLAANLFMTQDTPALRSYAQDNLENAKALALEIFPDLEVVADRNQAG